MTMIHLFEFQARKIERMAASLAHFVSTTPESCLDWCPATGADSQTRSIMAMIGECVAVNRHAAALLRGESSIPFPGRDGTPLLAFSNSEDAQQQLTASGQELAAAVRALDDEALTRIYLHWRGPLAGELIVEMPYRNMAYHAGQVNMIQLLTGDSEFHMPPTWL